MKACPPTAANPFFLSADMSRRYSRIAGTGSYLPPRRVSNDELVQELAARGIETSDQWIVERTGIRARHLASPDMAASDLAVPAARAAIARSWVRRE